MYLLDTNTLIYAFRRAGGVRERMATMADELMALSTVNLFELEFGFSKSIDPTTQRIQLAELTTRFVVLDFDTDSARKAGQIKGYLQNKGMPIGPYDLLIAGIALAHNRIVVTRNIREFSRVPGLRVDNWYSE